MIQTMQMFGSRLSRPKNENESKEKRRENGEKNKIFLRRTTWWEPATKLFFTARESVWTKFLM